MKWTTHVHLLKGWRSRNGTLKKVGLLGVDGEIMQALDGQHYEVIEGIGEFGEKRTMMRPVRLVIPAFIQGRARGHAGMPMPGQQPAMPSPQPAAPMPAHTPAMQAPRHVLPIQKFRYGGRTR